MSVLFVVGIDRLSRDDKIALLAQLTAVNAKTVLSEGAQKGLRQVKSLALAGAAKVVGLASRDYGHNIKAWDKRLDWNVEVLRGRMAEKADSLSRLDTADITRRLRARMAQIANVEETVDGAALATAIIHRAARSLKIDVRLFPETVSLEDAVFQAFVREQIELLKKRLAQMSPAELADFEGILHDEIAKLSKADQEAIRKATGLDELSGKAVVGFLRSMSVTALTQLVVGSFGFGAFLFLTTTLKALSLLLGMTFSFGLYAAATSLLAFLLSGLFLFAVAALSGGLLFRRTSTQLDDQLAKLLVAVGRAKLLSAG